MKKFFINLFLTTIIILNCTLFVYSNENIKINFLGNNYNLIFSSKGKSNGYFNEYIQNGQTLSAWNDLIIVHHFPNAKDSLTEAKKIAGFITAIYAKQNKKAPVVISYNDKKNEAIVDYILPIKDKKTKKLKCLEFNVFKYQKYSYGKGVIAFQYSKRFYPSEIKEEKIFQENLKILRNKSLNSMTQIVIPNIIAKDIR